MTTRKSGRTKEYEHPHAPRKEKVEEIITSNILMIHRALMDAHLTNEEAAFAIRQVSRRIEGRVARAQREADIPR